MDVMSTHRVFFLPMIMVMAAACISSHKSNKWNSRKHFYCAISRQNGLSTNNRVPFEIPSFIHIILEFYAHLVPPQTFKHWNRTRRRQERKRNKIYNINSIEKKPSRARVSQLILCIHFNTLYKKSHLQLLNYSHGDNCHQLKWNLSSSWR